MMNKYYGIHENMGKVYRWWEHDTHKSYKDFEGIWCFIFLFFFNQTFQKNSYGTQSANRCWAGNLGSHSRYVFYLWDFVCVYFMMNHNQTATVKLEAWNPLNSFTYFLHFLIAEWYDSKHHHTSVLILDFINSTITFMIF